MIDVGTMAEASAEPPAEFVCPLTMDLMTADPVMDYFGHTYERDAIEQALRVKPGVSPMTRGRYPRGDAGLRPNFSLKSLIENYRRQRDVGGSDHNGALLASDRQSSSGVASHSSQA